MWNKIVDLPSLKSIIVLPYPYERNWRPSNSSHAILLQFFNGVTYYYHVVLSHSAEPEPGHVLLRWAALPRRLQPHQEHGGLPHPLHTELPVCPHVRGVRITQLF